MICSLKSLLFSTVVFTASFTLAIATNNDLQARENQKPNVLFILTDDMGWGDMANLGHPYMQTPHLDQLAKEGTRFTRFHVNSSVCSPSRVAFMTGRYPAEVRLDFAISNRPEINKERGMVNWLDPNLPNLASEFKKAGYATAHFGKWHMGPSGKLGPAIHEYGFDTYRIVQGDASEGLDPYDLSDKYYRAKSTSWFVEDALNFMEKAKKEGKPFFVNLWTLVPHGWLNPTPEELKVYEGLNVNPDDFPGYMRDYILRAKDADKQMQVFCASMTGMDLALGHLFEQMKKLGLDENTIIVFSSDNGPEDYHVRARAANAGMGTPGVARGRKRSIYQGGTLVPCIVKWPNHVSAGKVDDQTVWSGVDLLPTLLSMANISTSLDGIDGEDVSNGLLGEGAGRTKPLFWEWKYNVRSVPEYWAPTLAVQDGKWRCYINGDGTNLELYDITSDPEESKNLALEHAEIADKLSRKMLDWKRQL